MTAPAAAAADPPPLLVIRGLVVEAAGTAGRPASRLLDGVDLTLHPGEVVGLVGESGAGKSTLGLAALGHARDGCRIAAGSVALRGRDLVRAPAEERRRLLGTRIAYVAQSAAAAFNPAHRLLPQCVEAPVRERIMTRRDATARAVALFRRLLLPSPESIGLRYPHQVSGGQLQRAMTAMAMIAGPDLIVFDEPTTALDVTTQVEVLASIRQAVRGSGSSALYITHDLAVVAQMADRITVLRGGRVVEDAPTATLIAAPQAAYTRTLWATRSVRTDPKPDPDGGAAPPPPVLRIAGVSAAYGPAPVLRDVSIDAWPGRTVAIVGESGSGKSTLARVVAGLKPPASGTVSLAGRRLAPRCAGRSRDELRSIQFVFQAPDTALNPRRTVGAEIARPLALFHGQRGKQERRERVRALLAAVELDPDQFARRLPGELSGGQKQRVAIARALAAEPAVLICDEVTSALDQVVAAGVLSLLARLQRELGLAIVFITHDLATVRAIADDVVVMQDGRVVRSGPKRAVLSPPFDPYTELLLASVPDMDPGWLDRHLAGRAVPGTMSGPGSGQVPGVAAVQPAA